MFHHLVLMGFKQALSESDRAFIEHHCELLQQVVPGLIRMRLVVNASKRSPQFTHAIVADFSGVQAHDHYQTTPEHDALRQFVAARTTQMVVLDYVV
ncbi:MAG: hypothetical protein BGO13_15235 [Burkholderiales bacterium 66-5]|jgi:hypothetical protein|uniref:Dabb family protein n=1 Tax=Comamonas badia TaxID=265291 RepID=UPI00040B54A4|nr:Dabb family protein [Comamonas badia]OJU87368.1 MAG: hypothetical protein BGO13_15235 [Burkholderiales bacterium 66-5]